MELVAEDIPLEIPYEDDDLLIVNKTRRDGRPPRGGQLHRNAGQRPDVPPQRAGDPGRRADARRAGPPHRQEHLGAPRRGQGTNRPMRVWRNSSSTIRSSAATWLWVGQSSTRTRDHHRKHRPQSRERQKMYVFRRRLGRQARRNPLEGIAPVRLRNTRGVPSRNGPHPPDPRPHGVDRPSAVQRRTLRRRPHPQGHDLRQVPAVRRELLRPDAPPRTTCPPAGIRAPRHAPTTSSSTKPARRLQGPARQSGIFTLSAGGRGQRRRNSPLRRESPPR